MKRIDFLRGLGLTGVGTVIAANTITTSKSKDLLPQPPACVLIPSETAGPFPLDLTENQTFFRQDVREDRSGVRHDLKLKIIGSANCEPMPNVRVNIWHCDKDGNYSGYVNQAGLTYLRGYQWTDANGEVTFTTIFPGWYNGRICHIHFQVWVSSVYAAVSQLTYPIAPKNAIYADNPAVYIKGADPLNFNQDGIFADGHEYQLATLDYNVVGESYDSYLEVTVQGTGTTGLHDEQETGGQFRLGQNQPNPYFEKTSIPFSLITSSDVTLEIWDLNGKKRTELHKNGLSAGEHSFDLNLVSPGLPSATYVYQLIVKNNNGIFRSAKVMSAIK